MRSIRIESCESYPKFKGTYEAWALTSFCLSLNRKIAICSLWLFASNWFLIFSKPPQEFWFFKIEIGYQFHSLTFPALILFYSSIQSLSIGLNLLIFCMFCPFSKFMTRCSLPLFRLHKNPDPLKKYLWFMCDSRKRPIISICEIKSHRHIQGNH